MSSCTLFNVVGAVVLLVLAAACTSGPDYPPPTLGQSVEELEAAQGHASRRPVFAFLAEGHAFALHLVNDQGALDESGNSSSTVLVFEDDRYIGSLGRTQALDYSACLAQTDGMALLAERLRTLVGGAADSLAVSANEGSVGDGRCPKGPDGAPPPVAEPEDVTFLQGVGYALVMSAAIALSIVLAPAAVGAASGAAVHDRGGLEAQEKVTLAMSADEVESLLGRAKATFALLPVGTEVRYWERMVSPAFWIGLEDGRVVWLRFDSADRWLNDVRTRLTAESTEVPPE